MLSSSKKLVVKNFSEEQIIVRDESYTFIEPVATSSPNVHKKVEVPKLPVTFVPLHQKLKQLFCDQVTKEEEDLKNELIEKVIKTSKISKFSVKPEEIYYSCKEESDVVEDGNKLKKPNEEEMLPSSKTLAKRLTRKARSDREVKNLLSSKTTRRKTNPSPARIVRDSPPINDLNLRNKKTKEEELMPPPKKRARGGRSKAREASEVVEAHKIEPIRTRSSTRLQAQSGSTNNQTKVALSDFSDLETPIGRGHLRRNRHNIATVTPGPNVNAPQTILRRPNPGETAISLTGSPLLVTSEQISAVPQITIPLTDGRVMSVLAKDGLNPNEFPTMDQQTLSKLKMLHDFLGKL